MKVPCGRCGPLNERAGAGAVSNHKLRYTGRGAVIAIGRSNRPVADQPAAKLPIPFHPAAKSTANWKKALVSMLVVGAFGMVVHPATFATFSAAVTNPAAITTGTVVLSSTAPTGGACLSVGAGTTITPTNTFTCPAGTTVFGAIPPGATVPTIFSTVNLPVINSGGAAGQTGLNVIQLVNVGNINASTVQVSAAATCTAAAGAGTYKGAAVGASAGLCNGLDFVIYQATTAAGTTMATNGCIYGNTLGTGSTGPVVGCTFDKNSAAAPAPGVQPAYRFTLGDFGTCHLFIGSGACAGGGINGPITLLNTGATNLILQGNSVNTAYIAINVAFPDTGDQSVMGTVASLSLTFQIGQ